MLRKAKKRGFNLSVNMPRLKNIVIKHLPSTQKLATEKEERHATES